MIAQVAVVPDLDSAIEQANATRYGLADRGIIREGMAADIVIFDEDDLIDTATYEDGKQLCQGIEYVLVNGKLALEKGEVVNGTAGRVVGRS